MFLQNLIFHAIGIVADRLVGANMISLTNVRKLFNSLASFIPVGCMIVLCFCDSSRQILGIISILILLVSSGELSNGCAVLRR
jgi:hypothetical protein